MEVESFYKCTLFSVLWVNKLTLVSKLETFAWRLVGLPAVWWFHITWPVPSARAVTVSVPHTPSTSVTRISSESKVGLGICLYTGFPDDACELSCVRSWHYGQLLSTATGLHVRSLRLWAEQIQYRQTHFQSQNTFKKRHLKGKWSSTNLLEMSSLLRRRTSIMNQSAQHSS